jgi:hypothetical protein
VKGIEYEQLVRAVLSEKLGLPPNELRSTRAPGAVLPNAGSVQHQIDLFYVQETELAKYVTIVECKYRESRPVDQELVQNLAFVRNSMSAHKAIMVTNKGYTAGATAVAESQQIALLVVEPRLAVSSLPEGAEVEEVFASFQTQISRDPSCCDVVVVRKFRADPGDRARDLASLLADPEVRTQAEKLLHEPGVREAVRQFAANNPDIARKAMGFLRRGRF